MCYVDNAVNLKLSSSIQKHKDIVEELPGCSVMLWNILYLHVCSIDCPSDTINLENDIFRNRENLQYPKTAGSVLLSLLMRINGKCNNSHAPSTSSNSVLLSARTKYS